MKGFTTLTECKVARISEQYAKRKNISTDNAMRIFLASNTYEILSDIETGVYLEVFEFVYDMFLEELGEGSR